MYLVTEDIYISGRDSVYTPIWFHERWKGGSQCQVHKRCRHHYRVPHWCEAYMQSLFNSHSPIASISGCVELFGLAMRWLLERKITNGVAKVGSLIPAWKLEISGMLHHNRYLWDIACWFCGQSSHHNWWLDASYWVSALGVDCEWQESNVGDKRSASYRYK